MTGDLLLDTGVMIALIALYAGAIYYGKRVEEEDNADEHTTMYDNEYLHKDLKL